MSPRPSALLLFTLALLVGDTASATPQLDPFVGADLAVRRPYLVPIGSGVGAVALRPTLSAGGVARVRTSEYKLDLGVDGRLYDYIGVSGHPLGGGGAELGLRVGSGGGLKPVLRGRAEYGIADRIEQAPLTLPHLDAGGSFGVLKDSGGALVGSLLFDVDGERWKGSYSGVVIGGRGQLGYRYLPRTDAPALRVGLHQNLALGTTAMRAEGGVSGKLGRRTELDAWVGYARLWEGGAVIPLTVPVLAEVNLRWRPRNATWLSVYGERQLETRAYASGDLKDAVGVAGLLQGAGLQARLSGDAILHQYLGSGLSRTDTTLRAAGELAWAPGAANHLWVVGDAYVMGRSSSDDSVSGVGWGVGAGVEYWPAGGRQRDSFGARGR